MRVLITGGGTGGHTSPAVAVIEEMHERDPNLVLCWVGTRGRIEERIAREMAIPFRPLPVVGWPRRRGLRQLWAALMLGVSLLRAYFYLRRFQPDCVFGVGGYVSLPAMLAAQRRNIPTFIHEQNQHLGMANRMAAPRATRIFLSFSDTKVDAPEARQVLVGNPVRAAFLNPPAREEACAAFGLDPGRPVILVSGGSQGAQRLNDAVAAILSSGALEGAQFIWLTGKAFAAEGRELARKREGRVRVFGFLDKMAEAYAAADVVVSRAGASSCAEIAAVGRPAVFVPFPLATDRHQDRNAASFVERGAALLLADADCTGPRLAGLLDDLLGDPARLERMAAASAELARPGAADTIVTTLYSVLLEPANR